MKNLGDSTQVQLTVAFKLQIVVNDHIQKAVSHIGRYSMIFFISVNDTEGNSEKIKFHVKSFIK